MKPSKNSPRHKKPLDATLRFQQCSPTSIRVSETLVANGITQRHDFHMGPELMAELEKRYIFYADEADVARKLLARGETCTFEVYLREP